ncbi:hypothetical protein CgunFtcFv8_015178 [Champsocephalus gunnari]|uniref:Uncharacterized protein n=1 Tax=Champsocephalus gunnari TaxID=52237 RepID=A0AAN8H0T6_CHAGU|nr:hypothetical protein CgunFtcFv8_015178 [Champsocephalus gunnari]
MLEEKPGKHDEEMLTAARDNKAEAGPGAAKRPPHLRIKTPPKQALTGRAASPESPAKQSYDCRERDKNNQGKISREGSTQRGSCGIQAGEERLFSGEDSRSVGGSDRDFFFFVLLFSH